MSEDKYNLPKSFREVCAWARYLYQMDPQVANTTDYVLFQIMAPFTIECPNSYTYTMLNRKANRIDLKKTGRLIMQQLLVYGESLPAKTQSGHTVLEPGDITIEHQLFTDEKTFIMDQGPILGSDVVTHLFLKAAPYDIRGTSPLKKYFKFLVADKPVEIISGPETAATLRRKQDLRDAVEWWMLHKVLIPYALNRQLSTEISISWQGGPLWDGIKVEDPPPELKVGQRWYLDKQLSDTPPGVYVIRKVYDDSVWIEREDGERWLPAGCAAEYMHCLWPSRMLTDR